MKSLYKLNSKYNSYKKNTKINYYSKKKNFSRKE